MKKIVSLLKACMTSDMNIFKIKQKKDDKKSNVILPFVLSFFFMFAIWSNANMIFEKLAPMHLQVIVISMVVFATSMMTIIEGVYKAGPLLFNCKDDQLLLSLPIKRSTVLFVRMYKFYVFELMFNTLFIIPLVVAYLRWAENLEWTFFLTSFVMILMLPIIPVAISCLIGALTSSLSSRFKFKNIAQIAIAMIVMCVMIFISINMDKMFDYIAEHATSINDFIMKLYYPAGIYAKLATNFNVADLLIFIFINIMIFIITLSLLSIFYFKINSRLKNITTSKQIKIDQLKIESRPKMISLIKKEINTFFKTPVFIVNAGFGLVLYIIAAIGICIKYEEAVTLLKDILPEKILFDYLPILIFILIAFASFMTSITNSVVSLEGKNINILKSLPIKVETILLSKVYAGLVITTIPILIGETILFIRFRIGILEMLLLLCCAVLIPLISHFIGLIINLKYPKLDWENSAEVVKQSMSSFLSVMAGMLLRILSVVIISKAIEIINVTLLLFLIVVVYLIIDIILYCYLMKVSIKDFKKLNI